MAAKSLMVLGTMSSAGKSFVTAGLCRIFRQDGYRTAPFKSQNMALNSYITADGMEMGRAQVMQAEAAGIAPDVRMNPILLKPTSDSGSQVIVNGEIYGTMRAQEYYTKKQELIPYILKAYHALAAENDIIVLEGAGSPAEINLKSVDIVNLGMAELSDSPAILVGDIDRGGVFASLYGTIMLLDDAERRRIRGIVINKFRGDVEILKSGLTMLEELTGIPVLGVVPYLPLELDDEDSLSERLSRREAAAESLLDVAVIRFPRISNFTDFEALEQVEGVSVRYVSRRGELGTPDTILLAGTKSTMADLRWLRQSGLEAELLKCHEKGVFLMGICGGFQMLGKRLCDPEQVEDGGELRGMGLLDVETVFRPEKHRAQTAGMVSCLVRTAGTAFRLCCAGLRNSHGRNGVHGNGTAFCHADRRQKGRLCLCRRHSLRHISARHFRHAGTDAEAGAAAVGEKGHFRNDSAGGGLCGEKGTGIR